MSTYDKVKQSLDEYNYCMLQYVGTAKPLTDEEIVLLESEGYIRVVGFDRMFKSTNFSTITFVKDVDGLIKFLELDICKRYIKAIEIEPYTQSKGILYYNVKHITLYTQGRSDNSENVNKFKKCFIGQGGSIIRKLNKDLGCVITIVEPDSNSETNENPVQLTT